MKLHYLLLLALLLPAVSAIEGVNITTQGLSTAIPGETVDVAATVYIQGVQVLSVPVNAKLIGPQTTIDLQVQSSADGLYQTQAYVPRTGEYAVEFVTQIGDQNHTQRHNISVDIPPLQANISVNESTIRIQSEQEYDYQARVIQAQPGRIVDQQGVVCEQTCQSCNISCPISTSLVWIQASDVFTHTGLYSTQEVEQRFVEPATTIQSQNFLRYDDDSFFSLPNSYTLTQDTILVNQDTNQIVEYVVATDNAVTISPTIAYDVVTGRWYAYTLQDVQEQIRLDIGGATIQQAYDLISGDVLDHTDTRVFANGAFEVLLDTTSGVVQTPNITESDIGIRGYTQNSQVYRVQTPTPTIYSLVSDYQQQALLSQYYDGQTYIQGDFVALNATPTQLFAQANQSVFVGHTRLDSLSLQLPASTQQLLIYNSDLDVVARLPADTQEWSARAQSGKYFVVAQTPNQRFVSPIELIDANQSIRTQESTSYAAQQNTQLRISRTITNLASTPQTIDISQNSSYSMIFEDSSGARITDTNVNGIPDTGVLAPGESKEFVATVFIRESDISGSIDWVFASQDIEMFVSDTLEVVDSQLSAIQDVSISELSANQRSVLVQTYNSHTEPITSRLDLTYTTPEGLDSQTNSVTLQPGENEFSFTMPAQTHLVRAELDADDSDSENNYRVLRVPARSGNQIRVSETQGIDHQDFTVKTTLPAGEYTVVYPSENGSMQEAQLAVLSESSDSQEVVFSVEITARTDLVATVVSGTPQTFDPYIVIDDSQAQRQGTWYESSQVPGAYAQGYLFDLNERKGDKQVEYYFSQTPTNYELYLWHPGDASFASNAQVRIGDTTILADQRKPAQWRYIGRYQLDEETPVTISNAASDGFVVADAIRGLRVDQYALPTGSTAVYQNDSAMMNESEEVDMRVVADDFVSIWDTQNSSSIRLPLIESGNYDFIVDWGDGTTNEITTHNSSQVSHQYDSSGRYTVVIRGQLDGIGFSNVSNAKKIVNITQWGQAHLGTEGEQFMGAENLLISASDIPNLEGVINLSRSFANTNLRVANNIDAWDVSSVQYFDEMFMNSSLNTSLRCWNVSLVQGIPRSFSSNILVADQPVWGTDGSSCDVEASIRIRRPVADATVESPFILEVEKLDSEFIDEMWYSLDNQTQRYNSSVYIASGNGRQSFTVWANTTEGEIISDTVVFTVDQARTPLIERITPPSIAESGVETFTEQVGFEEVSVGAMESAPQQSRGLFGVLSTSSSDVQQSPYVQLSRFNGSSSILLEYPTEESGTFVYEDEKMKWVSDDQEVHFYEVRQQESQDVSASSVMDFSSIRYLNLESLDLKTMAAYYELPQHQELSTPLILSYTTSEDGYSFYGTREADRDLLYDEVDVPVARYRTVEKTDASPVILANKEGVFSIDIYDTRISEDREEYVQTVKQAYTEVLAEEGVNVFSIGSTMHYLDGIRPVIVGRIGADKNYVKLGFYLDSPTEEPMLIESVRPYLRAFDTFFSIGGLREQNPQLDYSVADRIVSRVAEKLDAQLVRDQPSSQEELLVQEIRNQRDTEGWVRYARGSLAENQPQQFEVEIILNSRPDSNVFEYVLRAENLSFYYQPELSEQEISQGNYRNERYVGSYAVYENNQKAFHIYRPFIYDAAGNEVWGDIEITSQGNLRVIVPESFLDQATYPVVVDPTFGYETAGGSEGLIDDVIRGSTFTLGEEAILNDITGRIDIGKNTQATYKYALYDSSNDLVAVTTQQSLSIGAFGGLAWRTRPFTTTEIIPPGDYTVVAWGRFDGGDNSIGLRYDAGGSGVSQGQSYSGTWPSTLSPSSDGRQYSIYVDYDSVFMDVTLDSPADNFETSNGVNLDIDYTPSTNANLQSCALYDNSSGSFSQAQTDSGVTNTVQDTFTETYSEGRYAYNVECCTEATCNFAPANKTLTVDVTAPVVTLQDPADGFVFNLTRDPVLNYTVTDNLLDVAQCRLFVNNSLEQTDSTITQSTTQSFSLNDLDLGTYSWNVECTDDVGNAANSSQRTFEINVSTVTQSDTNGQIVDRENTGAGLGNITLVSSTSDQESGISVDFYISLTDPVISGEEDLFIGTAVTNATGQAAYTFDPDTSYYAGNYSWYTQASRYLSNDPGNFLIYGTPEITYQDALFDPNREYNQSQSIRFNATVISPVESMVQLSSLYGFFVNASIQDPDAVTYSTALSWSGVWTGTYTLANTARLGTWNSTLFTVADYFYTNSTTSTPREFNVTGFSKAISPPNGTVVDRDSVSPDPDLITFETQIVGLPAGELVNFSIDLINPAYPGEQQIVIGQNVSNASGHAQFTYDPDTTRYPGEYLWYATNNQSFVNTSGLFIIKGSLALNQSNPSINPVSEYNQSDTVNFTYNISSPVAKETQQEIANNYTVTANVTFLPNSTGSPLYSPTLSYSPTNWSTSQLIGLTDTVGVWNYSATASTPYHYQATSALRQLTVFGLSNLSLADDSDTLTVRVYEAMNFTANYSDTSNNPIAYTNTLCQVRFNLASGWTSYENMSYNAPSQLYTYERSFNETYAGESFEVFCDDPLYESQNQTSTFTINRSIVNMYTPNNLVVDRDGVAVDSDTIVLNASIINVPVGVDIAFYTNLSSPSLGQIQVYLGNGTTDASGFATYTWNPNSTIYAGNHSVYANQTYSDIGNSSATLVYGDINTIFTSPTLNPDANYTQNETATIQANATTVLETSTQLDTNYALNYTTYLTSSNGQDSTVMSYINPYWQSTYALLGLGGVGEWNTSVNATANFHYANSTQRNFTVYGYMNVTESSLTPTSHFVYGSTTHECRVQDQHTSVDIQNANVTFTRNGTVVGYNTTNSAGYAQLNFQTNSSDTFSITCGVIDQPDIYYFAGDQPNSTDTLTVLPFPVTPVSPANDTQVDRDGVSASIVDTLTLNVSVPSYVPDGVNITFFANRTDPTSASTTLGINTTSSGYAVITIPNTTTLAGNYTWYADAADATINGTRTYSVLGGYNVTFTSAQDPNATYDKPVNVTVDATLASLGSETQADLATSYFATANYSLLIPNGTQQTNTLTYIPNFEDVFEIQISEPRGFWGVQLNSSADYFILNNASYREFFVNNYPPTHTTPILNSTTVNNYTNETLTVYNQSTTDAEGDSVRNTVEWFVDSQSITPILVPMSGANASGTLDIARNSTFTAIDNAYHNETGGPDGLGRYVFDGTDDMLEDLAVGPELNGLDEFTVSVWVNSDSTSVDNGILLGRNPDGTDSVFGIRYDSSGFSFGGSNLIKVGISTTGGDLQTETSTNSQTTGWQHIVVRWSSGEPLDVYLDGSYDTPTGVDPIVTGTITGVDRLLIGRGAKYGDSSDGWQGSISQLQIFDRSLSPEQIQMLYQEGQDASRNAQIASNETAYDEVWQACITPNDGFDAGSTLCSNTLSIRGLLQTFAPNNDTVVDRDSVSADDDSINLTASSFGDANMNVSFYADLTNPAIGGQTELYLGSAISNTSGFATLNFNPNSSFFAGNYTWYVNATNATTVGQNRTFSIYGSLNPLLENATFDPNQDYNKTQTIRINATLSSPGPESQSQINSLYAVDYNATITDVSASQEVLDLVFDTSLFTQTYVFTINDVLGNWTTNLSVDADYFYSQSSTQRNFTLYSLMNVTDATLTQNPIFVYATTTQICEVSDAYNLSPVQNVNVSFYRNTTLLGYNTTNTSGQAQFSFATNTSGTYNVTCEIADQPEIYYYATPQINASNSLDVLPFPITPTNPVNDTQVDRDETNASVADVISLEVSVPSYVPDDIEITYYANLTDPLTQNGIILGVANTSSQSATLNYNPNSSTFAGNYTWYAQAGSGTDNGSRTFSSLGQLEILHTQPNDYPPTNTTQNSTVEYRYNLTTPGLETRENISVLYNAAINTNTTTTLGTILASAGFTNPYWNASATLIPPGGVGVYSIFANTSAQYFFSDQTTRNYTVYGYMNVTQSTLSPSTHFVFDSATQTCRVQDQDTSADVAGANVTFTRNGTVVGYNVTNTTGYAQLTFQTNTSSTYNVTCAIQDQLGIFYFAGDQPNSTDSLTVLPFPVTPTSPVNDTLVDRDSVNASVADSIQLNVSVPSYVPDNIEITYYANLTNPITQSPVVLGSANTSSSTATLNYNPNASTYAGNYSWYATASSGVQNGSRTYLVYGGLQLNYSSSTLNPDANYTQNQTVLHELNLTTVGPETRDNLSTVYNAQLNITTISPAGVFVNQTTYASPIWQLSRPIVPPGGLGQYNLTADSIANYFFNTQMVGRNYTVYGLMNVTENDLSKSIAYANEPVTVTCRVQDQDTAVSVAGANITFSRNATVLGVNTTNASGQASYTFTTNTSATYAVSCAVSDQLEIFYVAGNQPTLNQTLIVVPYPVDAVAPANNTQIDRDNASTTIADAITLNASVPGYVPDGENLTFFANLTTPSTTTKTVLGTALTTSGYATLSFNPDTTYLAGEWEWGAETTSDPGGANQTRIFDVLTGLSITSFNLTQYPSSNYTQNETAQLRFNLTTAGPETQDNLSALYAAQLNFTISSPVASNTNITTYSSPYWQGQLRLLNLTGVGIYNYTANASANYAIENQSQQRNFTVYGFANMTSSSLSQSTHFVYDSTTQECRVQDQHTGVVVVGANVSFYRNATLLGYNTTNATGETQFSFQTNTSGVYSVTCEVQDSLDVFYFAGDDPNSSNTLNVQPFPVTPISPVNDTLVDRDSVNASVADSIQLNVSVPSYVPDNVEITYFANLTDPFSQSSVVLGSANTSSATASFTYNPNSSSYAGNYSWYATASSGVSNGSQTYLVYGGLQLNYTSPTTHPNINYTQNETATYNYNLTTVGPETQDNLSAQYLAGVDVLTTTPLGNITNTSTYASPIWSAQTTLIPPGGVGIYNTISNASAQYFYNTQSTQRNFTVYGFMNVTESTLTPSTHFVFDSATQTCRVQDQHTSVDVAGANVTFTRNATIVGYNTTNSTGYAQLTFQTNTSATYNITCAVTDQTDIYYFAGDQPNSTDSLTVLPFPITPVAPDNQTLLDRDNLISGVSPVTQLNVSVPGFVPDNTEISFFANRTDPTTESAILLGLSNTTSSIASLSFDPNSSIYAGNYTWYATSTSGVENGTRTFVVLGTLNATNTNVLTQPNATYDKPATVEFNITLASRGPETTANIIDDYAIDANITLTAPNASQEVLNLTNDTSTWFASRSYILSSPRGEFNTSVRLNSTYFRLSNSSTRSFILNNLAPIHTTPFLNSSTVFNLTNETLTVYNQSTFDYEGDPVKYIWRWSRNGAGFTIFNMPFEGGSNSTFTKDYSGQGNNGTVVGAIWNQTGGYDGFGAYDFADTGYIEVPGWPNLQTDFSISAWINTRDRLESGQRVFADDESNTGGYALSLGDGGAGELRFYSRNMDTVILDTTGAGITDNTWHHVVAIADISNQRREIWVDGVLRGELSSDTGTWGVDLGAASIGGETNSGESGNRFDGYVDDVVLWNRTLTPEQINLLYTNRTDQIVSTQNSINDVWQACGTPNDGFDDGVELCSNTLTIRGLVQTFGPANNTVVDRDNVSTDPDTLDLVADMFGDENVNVSFFADLVNPSIAGQSNISLGTAISNSSGYAALTFDPNSSLYAGEYEWYVSAENATTVGTNRTFVIYGGYAKNFTSPTVDPNAQYNKTDIASINVTLASYGPESSSVLNASYAAQVNASIFGNTLALGLDASQWRNTTTVSVNELLGNTSVVVNSTAQYFYPVPSISRNTTIFSAYNVTNITATPSTVPVFSTLNIQCRVIDSYNASPVSSMPINFSLDGAFIGTNTSNSTGYVQFSIQLNSTGLRTVSCAGEDQLDMYYYVQENISNTTISVIPYQLDAASPANNTIIDRDSFSGTDEDNISLVAQAQTSIPTGRNITFYANITDPSFAYTPLVLGVAQTNSSGAATLVYDPNSSVYAGNYTWYAEDAAASRVNKTRTFVIKADPTVVQSFTNLSPQSEYNQTDTIDFSYNITQSNATRDQLGQNYSLLTNASVTYTGLANTTNLTYNSPYWQGNQTISLTAQPGAWQVQANTSGPYTYNVLSPITNITIYGLSNLTISDLSDTQTVRLFQNQTFFANYSDTANQPINYTNSHCMIRISTTGSYDNYTNMTYDSSQQLYTYSEVYYDFGNFTYNVFCDDPLYASQNQTDNFIINKSAINSLSPSNGTILDRDEQQADINEVDVVLNVQDAIAGINITFKIDSLTPGVNITNRTIGHNLTQAGGNVTLRWNPPSTLPAGSYEFYGEAGNATKNETKYVDVFGTLQINYTDATFQPNPEYNQSQTVLFDINISTFGNETKQELSDVYNLTANHTLVKPSNASVARNLTYNSTWSTNYSITASDEVGYYNTSSYAQANYFYNQTQILRNFTVFGLGVLDVFDIQDITNNTYFASTPIEHFANWTHTDNTTILGATCDLTVYNNTEVSMNYSGLVYQTNVSYPQAGIFRYNVTCQKPFYYENIAFDNVSIATNVSLDARYEFVSVQENTTQVLLEVENLKDHIEANVSLYTTIPKGFIASYLQAPTYMQTISGADAGTAVEWNFDNLTNYETKSILLNVTRQLPGRFAPLLGVRTTTKSTEVFG